MANAPSPTPFIASFIKSLNEGLQGDVLIHKALQGLADHNLSVLSESTAKKIIKAMRKSGATIATPGKKNAVDHLIFWIGNPIATSSQAGGSGPLNKRSLEPSLGRGKRKSRAPKNTSNIRENIREIHKLVSYKLIIACTRYL